VVVVEGGGGGGRVIGAKGVVEEGRCNCGRGSRGGVLQVWGEVWLKRWKVVA